MLEVSHLSPQNSVGTGTGIDSNKIMLKVKSTISLHFFLFECGSGSRKENDCGSMRIQIHSPGLVD